MILDFWAIKNCKSAIENKADVRAGQMVAVLCFT